MPADVKAIANYFISRANREGKDITHLKVQKLAYISHGWHLAIAGEPLMANRIEAWPYGPVVPELYYDLRHYGAAPIKELLNYHAWGQPGGLQPYRLDRYIFANRTLTDGILDQSWSFYGGLEPMQLSNMTHRPGSPWSIVRGENLSPHFRPEIPDDLIRKHYLALSQRSATKVKNG